MTFRSAAAGFYDLVHDGGTGNLGGFKSGCTSNLIPAGGILSAPDYTRTCICRYQNQTSLALVHDPEAEMWTFNASAWNGRRVRRLGINLGAPGDRRADDGTLWLDWPSRGGPSPDVPVTLKPEGLEFFRHHSALIRAAAGGHALAWVAASGVRNLREATVTICGSPQPAAPPVAKPAAKPVAQPAGPPPAQPAPHRYTVRLHFAEVDGLPPGQRTFQVRLQGRPLGPPVDIAREAGLMTALVREFPRVEIADKLIVNLDPLPGHEKCGTLLSGIELVEE